MNILDILDEKINGYYEKKKEYPTTIIMSKETKDKIFAELNLISALDKSWLDTKDNYRGIPLEIKKDVFIELRGE